MHLGNFYPHLIFAKDYGLKAIPILIELMKSHWHSVDRNNSLSVQNLKSDQRWQKVAIRPSTLVHFSLPIEK